ncbi:MAG: hypothetical protein ABI581_06585, partial [Sediminibacterium sp.]
MAGITRNQNHGYICPDQKKAMQVKTFGCAMECLDVTTVTIELSLEKGNHRVISGLPDDSVKESLARIDAAVRHAGFFVPDSKLVY